MKSLLKAIRYANGLWPYYLAVSISSILSALAALAIPFVLKGATDLIVQGLQDGSADVGRAIFFAALLFGLDIFSTLVRNYGGYLGDIMAAKLREQMSAKYYEHLLRLPQSYYDGELTGTIVNRLNRAIAELTSFLNIFANNFAQMLLTSILAIIVIARYSWLLALLVFVIHPVFLWLTTLTSKKWQALQNEKNLDIDIASGRFSEVIAQMRVVKSYVQESLELRRFQKRFKQTVDTTRVQSTYWHNMDVLRTVVLALTFFAVYCLIFVETVQGVYSLGDMVLLITLINTVRMPIFSLSFVVDQFQKAITGSKDYVDAMELQPDIMDTPHAKNLDVNTGTIVYDNVSFGYGDDQLVLRNISFTLRPGEKVALVGESGEGKSTLSNLLMRLYQPKEGVITIDGVDISTVKQASLRTNIATVFQDPNLFSGTIRENIAYANPRATTEQVEAAARAANAHDFIAKLEKGYNTEIGERGIRLSGGQKQRLAIARALLKDAPILILDEATSSLDSRAEQQVQEALDRLMEGRTTLIIAHRLSTIAHVDTIITLRGGKVDEIGSPSDLAGTDGIYAQLLELQMGTTERAKKRLAGFDIQA